MKIYCFTYLLFILLACCTSESEKKAISQVKAFVKANSVIYTTGVSLKDNESLNYIGLEMSGGEIIDNEKMPDRNLLSLASFVFYSSLNEEDKKDKNAIKIEIERAVNNTKREIAQTYKFTELDDIVQKHQILISLIQKMMLQDYQYVYQQFDDTIKTNLDYQNVKSSLERMDSKYGKIIDFHLQGFWNEKQESGEIMTYLSYTLNREHHKSGCDICVRKTKDKITLINMGM